MKKVKQADLGISIALIFFFIILSFINEDTTFIIGYFVVGGWQLISMIVHAVKGWFTEKGGRRYIYHWVVLCILLTALLGLAIPEFLVLLAYPMLFAAPFMAIYYSWICYNEVYVKMQRPLTLLK
ncbi:MAG: hypothetical protein ABI741_08335 [Ferruginibacter sp.]